MSEMMTIITYLLVDDIGQSTSGEDQAELWSVHEGKGGYSALQMYELTLTLPRPSGVIEIKATLPPDAAKVDGPITISAERCPSKAPDGEPNAR